VRGTPRARRFCRAAGPRRREPRLAGGRGAVRPRAPRGAPRGAPRLRS
jgi:hypothetical protein